MLEPSRQSRALINGALGVEFSGDIGPTDHMSRHASGDKPVIKPPRGQLTGLSPLA